MPVVTLVTDNGGPLRSFQFEAFITRPRAPSRPHPCPDAVQNGSRERGFGSMRYEWLFREEVDDGLALVDHISAYRADNHVRPHATISWNRPADVHGLAEPTIPNFEAKISCQLLDAGHRDGKAANR